MKIEDYKKSFLDMNGSEQLTMLRKVRVHRETFSKKKRKKKRPTVKIKGLSGLNIKTEKKVKKKKVYSKQELIKMQLEILKNLEGGKC